MKVAGRIRRICLWGGGAGLVTLFAGSIVGIAAQYGGWDIPPGAAQERIPVSSAPQAVSRGTAVYASSCARCHGPGGKGDGSDSDHASDLTDDLRIEINPEGVLFYKVWNGHAIQLRTQLDDMPAFAGRLSKDDVWAVVEFLKVLRTSSR